MNKKMKFGIIVLFLIAAIILSGQASALGITPGKTTIDFAANTTADITINIINKEYKDIKVMVYARGELKDYIKFDENIINISASESSKEIAYKVSMPSELTPGKRTADIVIVEIPESTAGTTGILTEAGFIIFKEKETVVTAVVSIVHQLVVKVPYPGKYAEIRIDASANENGVVFVMPVLNLGEQDIYNARIVLDIYGPTNEKLFTTETEKNAIQKKQVKEFKASWKPAHPGFYTAKATLFYDDKTATAEKIFAFGNLQIEVLDVFVKDFKLGGIAKFNIMLENKWNEKIENVYAEMIITDKNNEVIANIKSAAISIEPLARNELAVYWDTEGYPEGTYNVKLIIHYADKTTEKLLKAYVSLNSIKTDFLATGKVVAEKPAFRRDTLLMVAIIVLVVINIGWFVYMRKLRKKQR